MFTKLEESINGKGGGGYKKEGDGEVSLEVDSILLGEAYYYSFLID